MSDWGTRMSEANPEDPEDRVPRAKPAAPQVEQVFEERLKQRVLAQALGDFPEHERHELMQQIDGLGRRLDSLIEATRKVHEPLSFEVLLARLMALITDAFDADRSSLFLYDAESHELYSRLAQGELVNEIRFASDAGIAGDVFQSGESAIINNAYAEPKFNAAIDANTGYHTHNLMCVPLRTRAGELIGVTEVLNKRNGDFSNADCALLQAFTTHTAAVIESAQLTERAIESRREEARILEVTQAVSSELNIEKLLRKIISIATDLLEAERSTLFLHDPITNELWSRVAEGLAEREIRIPSNVGIAGEVFSTRQAVNIPDAYNDTRFNPEVDRKTGYRTRSILCVPVVNKHGMAVGVVQVLNRRGGPFRVRDQRRLEMLAAQSAIALENARLFREVLDEKNYSENVLRSLSDGVITLGQNGDVVKLNQAAANLLQLDVSKALGAPLAAILAHDNTWLVEAVKQVLVRQQAEKFVDVKLNSTSGAAVSANLSVTPLADTEGASLGCTVIIEDVTEDKRVRATMARYMTAEVAEQVLAAGESVLGGRSQPATVMFSDIRGFTAIAEQLGPQATVSMLNSYFGEMGEVVFKHNGILDKYIGDAIMAVFGTPFPREEDADNAIRSAIEMQQVLKRMNEDHESRGMPQLETRIGINSGDVVAGNIGSARRMDYTVIGDSVNIAARLEAANKELGTSILISDQTRQALKGNYRLRELDLIRVKGRLEPVTVYEVLGCSEDGVDPREQQLLQAFHSGLLSYRERDWSAAIEWFENALELNANDQPSWRFRQRALHYQKIAPPDDWDGVWTMQSK